MNEFVRSGLLGVAGGGLMVVALLLGSRGPSVRTGHAGHVAPVLPGNPASGEESNAGQEVGRVRAIAPSPREASRAVADAAGPSHGDAGPPSRPRSADEWVGALELDRPKRALRSDALALGKQLLGAGSSAKAEAVAGILREAGVPEHEVLTGIWDAMGHLQRLEQFARMAQPSTREAGENGEARPESPFPALFASRLAAYERYVRRDLEWRFGLRDPECVARLIGLAHAPPPRMDEPGAP